jgi:Pyruvate/2-oxoacid:ferredoxin oxidoreductase gamma subunit
MDKKALAEKLYQAFNRGAGATKIRKFNPESPDNAGWFHAAEVAIANVCDPEACEHMATNAKAFQAKVAELEKRHAAEIKKLEERRVKMELERPDPAAELDSQMSDGIKLAANMRDLGAMAKLCGLRLELQRVKRDLQQGVPVGVEPVDEPQQ